MSFSLHGLAGQALAFIILWTILSLLLLGLWQAWTWIVFEVFIKHTLKTFKMYLSFWRWIWYRRQFDEWFKNNIDDK